MLSTMYTHAIRAKLLVLECLFPTGRKREVSCAPQSLHLQKLNKVLIALVCDGPSGLAFFATYLCSYQQASQLFTPSDR
jgi:hypothetical protein